MPQPNQAAAEASAGITQCASSGYSSIANVPNTTTVATATPTSRLSAFNTGWVASTAAAPQMALPAPTSAAVFGANCQRRPSHIASIKVPNTISTSTSKAGQPT